MKLTFERNLVQEYKSASQKARVLTEYWVDETVFCPNCGQIKIDKYCNNNPAGDFQCSNCGEDYELKSKQNSIGIKIVDGAYRTMIEQIIGSHNPNFFLLNYDATNFEVINFCVVPKHFFVPSIIEKRKPLSPSARRAGWIGCNIILKHIPDTGKIFYVRDRKIEPKEKVLDVWKKTLFLREEKEIFAKGWLLDIMNCIDKIDKKEFTIDDVYAYADELSILHPNNKHVKDKIRQQLQILRDKGYLSFVSLGRYKLM